MSRRGVSLLHQGDGKTSEDLEGDRSLTYDKIYLTTFDVLSPDPDSPVTTWTLSCSDNNSTEFLTSLECG